MSKIADLNDEMRQTFSGGRVFMTASISALPLEVQGKIFALVRRFSDFNNDNDPYGEHDYGSFEHTGERIMWKIDYYNRDMTAGSEDPSDPAQTTRVLTIMLASDY
jgi:hypothetical protein